MVDKKHRLIEFHQLTGSDDASKWKTSYKLVKWQQLPDDHPIFNAIGRVASEWAYYEHILDNIIRSLINVEADLVTSVTAQMMGIGNRFNAISALCTVRNLSSKTHKKLASVKIRSFDVQDRRNRIVHDPWFLDPATNETGQFKSMPPKDLRYGVKPIEAAYIDETLQQIAERITEGGKLYEMVLIELEALRKKLPEQQPPSQLE